MLGIYLSPIYIILHIFMLRWFLKWLGNVSRFFKKRIIQILIVILYAVFFASVGIGFIMPQGTAYERFFKRMGNYALGVSLYEWLVLMFLAVIRFFRRRSRYADLEKLDSRRHIVIWGLVAVLLIASISSWGIWNAHHIQETRYNITIKKDGGRFNTMNIALVSDIHMGYNAGVSHVRQMVNKINATSPDVVVIAGDIFDNEYAALDHPDQLIEEYQRLNARYGVYAVYGNHDVEEKIFSGFTFTASHHRQPSSKMKTFLKKAHIKVLNDKKVLINHSVYLYGRPDAMTMTRKEAQEITAGMDMTKPIIVADHEPRELNALSKAGVDADLSGHTHNGQMFPANIIVSALYANSYGYRRIGAMHSIVTSGVGAWGPFMRVGTKAEICTIHITFQ